MPQYELGHLDLRAVDRDRRLPSHAGLALAGNAYHGVGVPQCIQSGEQAAERIARELGARFSEAAFSPSARLHLPPRRCPPQTQGPDVP